MNIRLTICKKRHQSLIKLITILVLFSAMVSSCTPAPTTTPAATVTPTSTNTVTPTIVWFPPTPTFTPFPSFTPVPTNDTKKPLGKLLFHDSFTSEKNWVLGDSPAGRVALGKEEISLTIVRPEGYISTYRKEPILTDYYLEIEAKPSLCMGDDQYGLIIRRSSSSTFYRFALSCNGQARVDLINGGTATSPQPWVSSASIPLGAPNNVKIGVLSQGKELSFWVNDQYQFSITDKKLFTGLIGMFIRSAGENAVTVNFANLKVYSLKK